MNPSMIVSAASMHAAQQKLDTVSHNIANVNTLGFKRRDASFQDILTTTIQHEPGFQKQGRMTPLGFPTGWGAKVSQIPMSLSQGSLQTTDRELDFAIEGNGLFQVEWDERDQQGSGAVQNRRAWTRDGSFHLTPVEGSANQMHLVTSRGEFVLNDQGQRIVVPANVKLRVSEEGELSGYTPDSSAPAIPLGRLSVGRVVRPQVLQNIGDNLIPAEGADDAILFDAYKPADGSNPIRLRQGMLEQSNVDLSDEMTELLIAQRAFQLNSRAFSSAEQMLNLAVSIRA